MVRRPHRLLLASAAVLGVGAGALAACDLEPDTHYGPHSGLSKSNLPAPAPAEGGAGDSGASCGDAGVVDAAPCTVSYANDVWPKMQGAWHCTDAKCHGGTSYQPQLDSADNAYANMASFLIGTKPYVNPCSTNPDASAFLCNISNPFCGTAQMPFPDNTLGSGPMSGGDITLVTTWLQCGAPKN